MNKLIRYNLSLLFGRWVIYVVPVVTLIVLIVVNLLLNGKSNQNFMLNNPWIIFGILFFFSIVFVVQTTLILFKSPKEDMTNSLLFSRPFSKRKIFFSQVFVNSVAIWIYSLFIALSCFVISSTYSDSDLMQNFKFAASILIGGLGIMFVFASLISLTTLFLSSTWTTFIWTILAIFIPIGSFVSNIYINKSFTAVAGSRYQLLDQDKDANDLYLDSRNSNPKNWSQESSFNDVKNNPYYDLAWIDPWYQLSGLYSLFGTDIDIKDARWTTSNKALDSKVHLNINSKDVFLLIRQVSEVNTSQEHLDSLKNSSVFESFINTHKTDIESLTIERQMLLFQKMIYESDLAGIIANYDIDKNNTINASLDSITYDVDTYGIKLWNAMRSHFDTTKSDLDIDNMLINKYTSNFIIVPSNMNVPMYHKHPIIEKHYIAIIWVAILLITSSAGMITFIKKDN